MRGVSRARIVFMDTRARTRFGTRAVGGAGAHLDPAEKRPKCGFEGEHDAVRQPEGPGLLGGAAQDDGDFITSKPI